MLHAIQTNWVQGDTAQAHLAAHRMTAAAALLHNALDVNREPAAVDWCLEAGVERGEIIPLYKLVRNAVKWAHGGRVPTTAELFFGVLTALMLLVRVAQDVQACVTDLGRPELAWVYGAFLNKVRMWLSAWPATALPSVHKVTSDLVAWCTQSSDNEMPSPAWVTAFTRPTFVGNTFSFCDPTPADVAVCARCCTLAATRRDVVSRLTTVVNTTTTWSALLGSGLQVLVATHL